MIAKRCSLALLLLAALGATHADKEARPITAEVTHVIVTDFGANPNVLVAFGKKPALEVEAPADMLADVVTEAQGERLTITAARNGSSAAESGTGTKKAGAVTVRVTLANLTQVDVRGPGDTSITGFDLDSLSLNAAGGGKTTFDGQAKTLQLRMAGAGDATLKGPASFLADTLEADVVGTGSLDAEGFRAAQVNLNMAGTSDVSIFASKSVTVRGAGTGDLTIAGNPEQRSVAYVGTGTVSYKRLRA